MRGCVGLDSSSFDIAHNASTKSTAGREGGREGGRKDERRRERMSEEKGRRERRVNFKPIILAYCQP